MVLVINVIDAAIVWWKVQKRIRENPALRPGYLTLIKVFLLAKSVPWLVMGIGVMKGGLSWQDYLDPNRSNPWVVAWLLSLLFLLLLYFYWICFRQGAEILIRYPGVLRRNRNNPKIFKIEATISLFIFVVATIVFFAQKPG